ncbi:Pyruvate dehydrogenase (acetyl-transferring) [Desulfotomaculum nigrificans CO-1-SRB]|uniref:Pyruvate dehydrogenase (Acetyl-transferring) n=2 Tax=Desulfotomaculum nigrificans TaxID=1565 RepID=F6B901_DESCC|nr:alpha-ketoacid dehydrogenase subunit beta [Desulfotomaculum nigrificans]AEF93652.1 Pyruvate dehydrogenase (acetyl-transferring) [Desulfotomaculum nigrificans CO-1-SRB]
MVAMTFSAAINAALKEELMRDENVFIFGEDVGIFGGCFGVTAGLYQEFGPERVIDTPISETAIIGVAVGAAAAGLRPVPEIMFMDFMGVCMDEIFNQATKMRYMFGGKAKIPMTIRTAFGAGFGAAAQHSQSIEAWFTHIPGLKVVMPSTPADAKGLLVSAIRDDNPVLFLEHKGLYAVEGEVPEGSFTIPLGKADIKREGNHVTIVATAMMVHRALQAAEELAAEGIEAEVVDPRTLQPLDKNAILKSVEKTGRLVIVQEAVKFSSFASEVAAIVSEEGFDLLDAPIKRVTAPFVPVPFSPPLEQAYIPSVASIVQAVKELG